MDEFDKAIFDALHAASRLGSEYSLYTSALIRAVIAGRHSSTPNIQYSKPTTPASLTASVTTGSTFAQFTWTASSSTDDLPLLGYYLYRNGVFVGSTVAGVTEFTDTGLTAATAYSYTARAFTSGAVSDLSGALVITTDASGGTPPADVTPPSVPANLRGLTLGSTSIAVYCDLATDDVAVAKYKFYKNGAYSSYYTEDGGTPGVIFGGLTPGATYDFTVSAVDTSNNESAQSAPLRVSMPAGAPPPPARTLAGGSTVAATAGAGTINVAAPSPPGRALAGAATVAAVSGSGPIAVTPPASTEVVWSPAIADIPQVNGTAGEYDLSVHMSSIPAEGVDLTVASGTLPSGTTLDSPNKKLVWTAAVPTGTVGGLIIRATKKSVVSGGSYPDADWTARKAAITGTGAWSADFTTNTDVTGPTPGATGSGNFYQNYLYDANGNPGNSLITRVAGGGIRGGDCMRITHPGNTGANPGNWARLFKDGQTDWPIGTPLYLSFYVKIPAVRFQTANVAAGWKTAILAGYGRSGWGNTCQGSELTLQNSYGTNVVQLYTNCGTDVTTLNFPASGDIQYQNQRDLGAGQTNKYNRYCLYNQWNTGACIKYRADQWMGLYYVVTPRTNAVDIEFYCTFEGMTDWIALERYLLRTPWTTTGQPFNTLTLTSYTTGRAAGQGYPDTYFDVTEIVRSDSAIAPRRVW